MFFIKPFSFNSRSLGNLSSVVKFICMSLLLVAVAVPRTIAQSVPPPPQGTQADAAFADSFKSNHVLNVFATTQKTSCYTPDVPYPGNFGPATASPLHPP